MLEKHHKNQNVISIKSFVEKKEVQRLDFAITKSQTLLEILVIEITQKRLAQIRLSTQITQLQNLLDQITKISHKNRLTKSDRATIAAMLTHEDIQAMAYVTDEAEKCLNDPTCSTTQFKKNLVALTENMHDFLQIYHKNYDLIAEQLEKIKEHLPIHLAQARSLLLKAKHDETFPRSRYEQQKQNFSALMTEFDLQLRPQDHN